MLPQTALLIIDMQNDFLTQGGASTKQHIEPSQLSDAVLWTVQAARQQQRKIAWITSHYGEVAGSHEELLGRTHTGTPCCVKGSWGAQVIDALLPSFQQHQGAPNEQHAIKHWYSAFESTNLHSWLQSSQVKKLILCGVSNNNGIFHTARAARMLGYEVEVLSDATTAGTQNKHLSALRDLEKLGVRARLFGELLSEGDTPLQLSQIAANDCVLWCNALSECINEKTFETLEREVKWSTMSHRGGAVPRLVAIQGTKPSDSIEPLYRHPVDEQPTLTPWTPTVDAIRRAVEKRIKHPLNHCLLQLYRHGKDWISEHSDKTLDLVRPSSIINVSLGHMRTMLLRHKNPHSEKTAVPQKLPLPHGSFFVMGLETNRAWYHGIKQQGPDTEEGPRISLTMRHIGTFWDAKTGAVWGTGAPTSDPKEAERRANERRALSEEEQLTQEREEAERMLRLFREENMEPTFDAATAYRPGFEVLNFKSLLEQKA